MNETVNLAFAVVSGLLDLYFTFGGEVALSGAFDAVLARTR